MRPKISKISEVRVAHVFLYSTDAIAIFSTSNIYIAIHSPLCAPRVPHYVVLPFDWVNAIADCNDCMVEVRAALIWVKNSAWVELEYIWVSFDSNNCRSYWDSCSQGLSAGLSDHCVTSVTHRGQFCFVIVAIIDHRDVRVINSCHNSFVSDVVQSGILESTCTAKASTIVAAVY